MSSISALMFKGPSMWIKKTAFLAAGLAFLAATCCQAGNNGLAEVRPVPVGERVAAYLQGYLTKIFTVLETKNSGGFFDGTQTYRAVVAYDPDAKNLDITLVGTQQDTKVIDHMMGVMRQIILKLNPKLQKDYGVTLQDGDLSMDYLYAKTGQVLERYRDGDYLGPLSSVQDAPSTPTPSDFSNP